MSPRYFRLVAIVLAIGAFCAACSTVFAASQQKSTTGQVASVPGDRWMEIDVYWFDQKDIPGSVKRFWDRYTPLYEGVQGYRGVMLNVGWTVDYIMEWSGDPSQRIPLPSDQGQARWVDERGALSGTTADRMREAQARFAQPVYVQKRPYGPWTYGDLHQLANQLKKEAVRRGITGLKVGSIVIAFNTIYNKQLPPWALRHPEAYVTNRYANKNLGFGLECFFNPGALLHADTTKLGGLPNGIPEGMPAHKAFGAQWGSLSKTVGLDAIMLRDSFGMIVPYLRGGIYGPVMPSPELIRQTTATVAALVRETKLANPKALVMMYANGGSAISDWRSNGLDLEKVAKEGYLDIFVDQTFGNWGEVGTVPDKCFWFGPTLGWTYQLANMLLHSAILADTKVRHYPVAYGFDAWEPEDAIHTVPQRTRWGIWAYSHAAVKTLHGLKMPDGSYILSASQGERLLSPSDVDFFATNLNAAALDAAATTEVYGPTIVYSRAAMQWQADHAKANQDIKEWVDEQAGSVVKWPVPILSATRMEWLPRVKSDLFILQTPSHLPPSELGYVQRLIRSGQPVAIFGSPSGVDPSLLRLAGLSFSGFPDRTVKIYPGKEYQSNPVKVEHVPLTFPVQQWLTRNTVSKEAQTTYSADGGPALVLNESKGMRLALWDPPDFQDKTCSGSLKEIWGGSAAPYALAAGVLNHLVSSPSAIHAASIDVDQTFNFGAWRTKDGRLHILAGNMEEGLRGDADQTRNTVLDLPESWRGEQWSSVWKNPQSTETSADSRLSLNLGPQSSMMVEAFRSASAVSARTSILNSKTVRQSQE